MPKSLFDGVELAFVVDLAEGSDSDNSEVSHRSLPVTTVGPPSETVTLSDQEMSLQVFSSADQKPEKKDPVQVIDLTKSSENGSEAKIPKGQSKIVIDLTGNPRSPANIPAKVNRDPKALTPKSHNSFLPDDVLDFTKEEEVERPKTGGSLESLTPESMPGITATIAPPTAGLAATNSIFPVSFCK